MQTGNIFAQLISQHCDIIYLRDATFSTLISFYCRDATFSTLLSFYCRDAIFSTLISFYCRNATFSTLISFYCRLPWCNIFYLDIILLPWCNVFYLDIISLPSAVIQHFLPWYHFTAVIESFLLWLILLPWFDILSKGSNPVQVGTFFRLSFRNCKSCVYNCDDLPSYSKNIVKLLAISQTIHTVCCEDDYFPKEKFKLFNSLFHS